MIPVFQTRFSTETFGNCYEACLASILELPLSAIPDRLNYLDADAWADLVQRTRREGGEKAVGDLEDPTEAYDVALAAWLEERGLGLIELPIGKAMSEEEWLEQAREHHRGYWIGIYRATEEYAHALVGFRELVVHNPQRHTSTRRSDYGALRRVHLLTAANPATIARRLSRELLPDVAGESEKIPVRVVALPETKPILDADGRLIGGSIALDEVAIYE